MGEQDQRPFDPDPTLRGPAEGPDRVLAAVEDFVRLHAAGQSPDLASFCARYPAGQRAEIESQCRLFLEFDHLVGKDDGEGAAEGERRLGDFVLREELGRGGMGVVYLAWQVSLRRQVALKILSPGLSFSGRHAERFRREAAAAGRLHHPGIVPIYAHGEVEGTLYYAMEYVPGRDLATALDELRESGAPPAELSPGALGMLPGATWVAEVAEVCAQIAEALAAAHAAGIVHRDVKPRNVQLGADGHTRVLDFGLAKDLERESVSLSGELTGTPCYMSPEQSLAKRAPIDHRTDVFSLGAILYECLTLQRAFDGDDLQQIVYRICFQEPAAISRLNPRVPRDLVTICNKALEKDPAMRYPSAAELAADLRRFLRWEPIAAKPSGVLARVRKWARRHRAACTAAAALLAAGVVGVAAWSVAAARDHALAVAMMEDAERHADRGELVTALGLATQAVRVDPDDDALSRRLGGLQSRQERERASHRLFALASSTVAQDPDVALRLALEGAQQLPGPVAASTVLSVLEARVPNDLVLGHEQNVLGAAIDPTGRTLATLCADGTARLWTFAEDRPPVPRCELRGHGHYVFACAFDPAGRRVATASYDMTVRLWDTATGSELRVLDGWTRPARSLSWSPDGAWLATGSFDGRVIVFDAARGVPVAELADFEHFLEKVCFDPTGRRLAAVDDRGVVRVWATAGWRLELDTRHDRAAFDCAFDGGGERLAVGDAAGAVTVYDLQRGSVAAVFHHSDKVLCVRFSPDGELLASSSEDQTVRLWSLAAAREEAVLKQHTGKVYRVEFDPRGDRLVTAADDRTARVFDVATGQELAVLRHGDPVTYAMFDPSGRHVLAGTGREEVRLWHLDSRRDLLLLTGHRERCQHAACDPRGEWLATASDDGFVRLWRRRTGELVHVLGERRTGNVHTVDFDAAGGRVCAAVADCVRVWSTGDGALLRTIQCSERKRVYSAFFVGDGARIVTASEDGTARLWDVATGVEEFTLRRRRPVRFARVDPSGELLVTVEDEPLVRVWDLATGAQRLHLRGHGSPATWASFAPDGKTLATASTDQTVRLWSLADGAPLGELRGHQGKVNSVEFDPTGTRIVTASEADRTARLWDVATRAPLLIGQLDKAVESAVFGPDGSTMLVAARDRTVRLWPTDPIAVAERQAIRELTWAERVRYQLIRPVDAEAHALVDELFTHHELAAEVVAAIEAADVPPETRRVAVAQARERGNPSHRVLHDEAQYTVLSPDVEREVAERALRKAESALRLEPQSGEYHATVGIALYRLGRFDDALASLTEACSLKERGGATREATDAAFLAMTLERLGKHAAAQAELERARALAGDGDGPARGVLEEAITVIEK